LLAKYGVQFNKELLLRLMRRYKFRDMDFPYDKNLNMLTKTLNGSIIPVKIKSFRLRAKIKEV